MRRERKKEGGQKKVQGTSRLVARINFGEVRDPTKVDLSSPKSKVFESQPLNPYQIDFWSILRLKVDFLADFGWCFAPHSLVMGLNTRRFKRKMINEFNIYVP